MTTLYLQDSGEFVPATKDDVLSCAQALLSEQFRRGKPVLETPALVRDFLALHLKERPHEVFGAIYLSPRRHLIAFSDLFRGTLDHVVVHPREIVRTAIEHNAAALIVYHNHPSGHSSPSEADRTVTQQIKEALALVDIRLLDHFVIGEGCYSFAENGEL